MSVGDLTAGATDANDEDALGVAVIGTVDPSIGTLSYLLDGVMTEIGAVDETNALLLPPEAELIFETDAGFVGAIDGVVQFAIWDQSSGAAESMADATIRGGTTAFSDAVGSVGFTQAALGNTPPSDIELDNTTVAEHRDGAFVGFLSTEDVDNDAGDLHEYTVDDQRFEVDRGMLLLKRGTTVD